MYKLVFLFIFFTFPLYSNSYSDFESYQYKMTRSEVENKIAKFLLKDPKNTPHLKIEEKKVIFLGDNGKEEFVLHLTDQSKPKNKKKQIKKIAIDPGHLGGKMSLIEERFIDSPAFFDEGTLNYLTALYLKDLLVASGFEVMITKKGIGEGAYPVAFHDWLAINKEKEFEYSSFNKIFRCCYNELDLEERSRLINAFQPDITIIIHYNAEPEPTERNYNLMHIPGSFLKKELSSKSARIQFLRLLVTDDVEESLKLSKAILKEMTRFTKVEPVKDSYKINYLENSSLKASSGVYSRNLRLTRTVSGPLCYGETLIQNNFDESKRLAHFDTVIHGIKCSSKVKDVALGYYYGIMNYSMSY